MQGEVGADFCSFDLPNPYGTTMSASKSYFEGALTDEELTQHDGIAIAATGNWDSRRGNGCIIGLVGSQLQCAGYKAPLMQAVGLRHTDRPAACPANGRDKAETFSTPCDLVWFTTIAEAVYGLMMVSILGKLPT